MPQASPASRKAPVDVKAVEHHADLSRLSLSPEEAERLRGDLASILGYFSAIREVENPSASIGGAEALEPESPREGAPPRADTPGPSMPAAMLEGAPQKRGRYVKAPRVF